MRPPALPVKYRAGAVTFALVAAAWASGLATAVGYRTHVVTHTRVVSRTIAQEYGKPDQTIPGAQVNAQLAGYSCDVYQARKTIVCHP